MNETSPQKEAEEKGNDVKMMVPFRKLFSYADPWDALLMVVGTLGAIGCGLTQPLMSLIAGDLVQAFGNSQTSNVVSAVSKVKLICVTKICLPMGCGIAAFLQVVCWTVTGERQAARIRGLYLRKILQQEIAYFDKEVSTGEVTGRMSGDMILIQNAMGEKVGMLVQVVSAFVGGFTIAFTKGWLLTLVMLSSIPLLVISGWIMCLLRSNITSDAQNAYASAATLVQQTIGSIRTVASFTGENQAVAKYKIFLADTYKSGVKDGLYSGLGFGFFTLMMFCTQALCVWFGAKMIIHNGHTGGDVFTIILAILSGSSSLGYASPCIAAFNASQAAAFKIFETINRKPHIDAYDTSGKTLEDIRGDIELINVCFSYPTRPTEQVFKEFSLFIPSGTITALVGQSGSGKSTVVSLIERFYDPQSGEVLIDGINLRELQLKWIRSKIGLVCQEPVLFRASIKDNIAYGKVDSTLDEIRAAADLANASDFIDKLPKGLDTAVGENGIQLSGGQKQRVAIARAIIKNPRILLLDEATSALDADSERIVQEALEKVMRNRTTVIVAHRLSTVRNADMIAVLHQGKIVERGTHSELLQDSEGTYSSLLHSQEKNEDVTRVNGKSMADITVNFTGEDSQRITSERYSSFGSQRVGITNSQSMSRTEQANEYITCSDPKVNLPVVSISRLACLNKPESPVLVLGALSACISGAVLPIFGLLFSNIIISFYKPPRILKKDSEFCALMLVLLGSVALVTYPVRTYLFGLAGSRLIRRIRLMCFQKVVNMEVGWFDEPDNSTGVIGARLSTDAAMVRALVGDSLVQLVEQVSSTVIGLVIAFEASWQLASIVLAMIPLTGFNYFVQAKSTKGFSTDAKVRYEEASQVANDAVGNIRTVASFCTQENIIETYEKKRKGPVANGSKQALVNGVGYGISIGVLYLVYATTFYAGARLVEDGKITMSDVFRVFFSLTMVAIVVSTSNFIAPDSNNARSAATSIFAILDRKSKIDPSDESGMMLENLTGNIKLRGINFKYPTRPGIQILENLNLTIHSGKVVALVGESGSGKSTVISLLQRFYNPDSGQITLDGIEIQKFQLKWLRQQMGLVSQEPILFNQTIRTNIAFGKEGNVTEEEIIAAARLANAHDFISGLKQGYDTVVGERGIQLSGGQKHRVAIARAIVKSPKILLLDEATSALDSESEKIVQEALDRVMLNRTTLVVAHRLSTIRGADTIAVFKNGCIAEKGNHNTLINIKDGLYSSLVRLHMTSHP